MGEEQLPLPGPEKGECQGNQAKCGTAGCPKYGTLGRPARDDLRRVKGCGDPVARGKRSKRKGQRKQAMAAKALGIPRTSTMHPGHEEFFPGTVRVEVKAGAQIKPAVTAYLKMRGQADASQAIGDNRPFVGVAMPDGATYGVLLVRTDELEAFIVAMVEQLFGDGL